VRKGWELKALAHTLKGSACAAANVGLRRASMDTAALQREQPSREPETRAREGQLNTCER